MRKQKGFSLIELLIVVAIILIIAAIAIPNLLKAKMAANESSAASQLRTMTTAQVSYLNSCGGYSQDEIVLGPGTGVLGCDTGMSLLDNSIAPTGGGPVNKGGYTFTYHANGTSTDQSANGGSAAAFPEFAYTAFPIGWKSTGVNGFCVDQQNVVHKQIGDTAAPTDGAMNTTALCDALPTI